MIFYTIGVYNLTEELFFEKLTSNNIDIFCDIRQRRGVRGAKYKFVNSIWLQKKLNNLNIKYLYIKELAPTVDIRNIQKKQIRLFLKASTTVINWVMLSLKNIRK